MIATKHSQITIKGSDLASTYGVYLILIKDNNDPKAIRLCYIGQTGDAKHISARSAFYRIAAHLGYSKSTQNQVFKAVVKHLGLHEKMDNRLVREKVEAWFADKTLDIHFYKTDDFEFLEESDDRKHKNYGIHKDKRRKTLILETALLHVLKDRDDVKLMNESLRSVTDFGEGIEEAERILGELGFEFNR